MATTRIASVHFAPVQASRIYKASGYRLPAVALNAEPAILLVDDVMQYDDGPFTTGQNGNREKRSYPVMNYEIARCIVAEWTASGLGMNPEQHPGIWIVRDRIPMMKLDGNNNEIAQLDVFGKQVFREATADEKVELWEDDLANNRRADRAYAEWCFAQGNAKAEDKRVIQFIPYNYKLAARHYGFEADWLKGGAAIESMQCPYCTKVIGKTAKMCMHCAQPVDLQWWAEFQARKDSELRDAKKQLQAA